MENLVDHLYELFCKCPVVCIDSRKIANGCLFFGLNGDHVDGSSFGAAAVDLGASIAVVRKGACEEKTGVFFVDDPLKVLQDLAQHHRLRLDIPFIGITGSNGKTTTKELLTQVLSTTYSVAATPGNLNNHIGVPLTVLSVRSTHQFAIIEMGANHRGEISRLCEIAQPTHGAVTNIGKAHLEGFGGLEGVKLAKSELYESLAHHDGIAFINTNEPFLTELSEKVEHRVRYQIGSRASYNRDNFSVYVSESPGISRISFVDASGKEWTAQSKLFGSFNQANIATAIVFGLFFEIHGEDICAAIESYVPDNNRAQRIQIGSRTFILDAYNANPTSMTAAIMSFQSIVHPKKMMILGAMMELGEYTATEHFRIVSMASAIPDITTIYVGEAFKESATKMGAQWYADADSLTHDLKKNVPENILCLVKGSRAMRLESLLTSLK